VNKTIQDLKVGIETIKKSQRETILELENEGKRSTDIDASITNRIQEIEERISGAEDSIENINTKSKKMQKQKNLLTQNFQEIQDTMRRPNLKIIGIEESKDFQLKGPVYIFNKIMKKTSLT
jgi:predicted ribosome quality control (RQC) complex YloA/Tae2 family protein